MRWLNELLHPNLKCERKGHKPENECITIRSRSDEYRSVVKDERIKITKCRRCGLELERKILRTEHFQSCSMPTRWWDIMDDNGFIKLPY